MKKGTKMKRYSEEEKIAAVSRYCLGESARKICEDLDISSPSMLYNWYKKSGQSRDSVHPREHVSSEFPAKTKRVDGRAEAIIFLRHARDAALQEVRNGKQKKLSRHQLYTLLALDVLEGG